LASVAAIVRIMIGNQETRYRTTKSFAQFPATC